MRKFRIAMLFMALGLITAHTSCSNEDDTFNPDSSQERLYLATKNTPYNVFTGTGGLKNFFLVLLPDGTAYNGLPKESTIGHLSRQQLIEENRLRVGEYVENGNELTITWTFNQNKVWNLKKEASGWRQNSTKKYELIQPADVGGGLDGTYVYEHVGASGFPGITVNTAGIRDVFEFKSDGQFTRTITAGGSSNGGVGTNASQITGTYTLEGYALYLKGNDGTSHTFTVFKWPKEESTVLALNGKRFLKE